MHKAKSIQGEIQNVLIVAEVSVSTHIHIQEIDYNCDKKFAIHMQRHWIQFDWCGLMCSFDNQWLFGEPRDILVLFQCFNWSQHSHLPEHSKVLHAFFFWELLWRCWLHFFAGHGTNTHWQRYLKRANSPWWCWSLVASKLDWSEPHRDSIKICQVEDKRTNNANELNVITF